MIALRRLLPALALVALAVAAWRLATRHTSDPLVATPLLALEAVAGTPLYFNGAAHPWVKAQRSELLPADAADAQSERARSYAQAVQEPKRFRQLDRRERFATLLLVGNPAEFRPLLDHLLETKDFRPAYVDHWAIVFRRGAEHEWQPAHLGRLRERVKGLPAEDRAQCFAETAVRLSAVLRTREARALLDEAAALAADSPAVWNGRAVVHAHAGEWKEALACAERALGGKLEPLSALATKVQALYAMKQFSPAYELSKHLIEKAPEDPALLFYHAKIAHEANAFRAEIAALEKLIARAEAERRPTSGYHIYLGQAYASVSDAERAIAAFTKALADAELPAEQREFAEDNLRRIKKRAGL